MPIDRDLKEREIRHILDFSEAKVLIASDDYLKLIQYDRESLPALQTTISMGGLKDGSDLSFVDALAQGAEILNSGDRNYATAEVYPDDLAVIIFTSGTTGTSSPAWRATSRADAPAALITLSVAYPPRSVRTPTTR